MPRATSTPIFRAWGMLSRPPCHQHQSLSQSPTHVQTDAHVSSVSSSRRDGSQLGMCDKDYARLGLPCLAPFLHVVKKSSFRGAPCSCNRAMRALSSGGEEIVEGSCRFIKPMITSWSCMHEELGIAHSKPREICVRRKGGH